MKANVCESAIRVIFGCVLSLPHNLGCMHEERLYLDLSHCQARDITPLRLDSNLYSSTISQICYRKDLFVDSFLVTLLLQCKSCINKFGFVRMLGFGYLILCLTPSAAWVIEIKAFMTPLP